MGKCGRVGRSSGRLGVGDQRLRHVEAEGCAERVGGDFQRRTHFRDQRAHDLKAHTAVLAGIEAFGQADAVIADRQLQRALREIFAQQLIRTATPAGWAYFIALVRISHRIRVSG